MKHDVLITLMLQLLKVEMIIVNLLSAKQPVNLTSYLWQHLLITFWSAV